MIRKLWRVLLVLWAGSLWSLALWVTWAVFAVQPDRHLAGLIVARLFTVECYLGLVVGALAWLLGKRQRFIGGYLAAALLAINEWALEPAMEAARSQGTSLGLTFGAWHGVSAILYIIACVGVLVSVWNEDFR